MTNTTTEPQPADDPDSAAVRADSAESVARLTVERLNLKAGGRQLLIDASARFDASQVTLIVGCSGVGKSLLLRIIAGLIESTRGAVEYDGAVQFSNEYSGDETANHADRPVAVVFQNFALFDELSPINNVRIALDHCGRKSEAGSAAVAESLVTDLGIPTDRHTAVLSGGQRQRLAIARALGMDTDVVLYDEPTSGLDTRTAQQVTDVIRDTQKKHKLTTIIVTHDFESLSRIADRIIVLDHQQKILREIPRERWHRLAEELGDPPTTESSAADLKTYNSWKARTSRWMTTVLERTGQTVEDVVKLPWSLLPVWKSIPWGLRITWHYLRLVCGMSAILYIAVAGMIIGYVSQDFVFRYLPFRQFTEPLLTENLLHATGFSLYRFLVPILATILIAARSGAAVAADVGSKVYGNQLDAMKTIGMNPSRSVRTPILYSFLIGTPLLAIISYAVAAVTAAFAFLLTHPDYGIAFWDGHFHRELILPDQMFYKGTGWLVVKLLTCGIGIGMISWRCGSTPKQSSTDISQGVTRTILWSTLFVLFVHFVFSLMEFKATV
jgi:ABC-type polar amino acid transport system ATPase subunit/ABC-type transporter Mla maintaining outer membrane lipid asymmetry permease subunit MlaE